MNLTLAKATSHGAPVVILISAANTQFIGELSQKLRGIADHIVFHAEPQRNLVSLATAFGGSDQPLEAPLCNVIVRQMYLFSASRRPPCSRSQYSTRGTRNPICKIDAWNNGYLRTRQDNLHICKCVRAYMMYPSRQRYFVHVTRFVPNNGHS